MATEKTDCSWSDSGHLFLRFKKRCHPWREQPSESNLLIQLKFLLLSPCCFLFSCSIWASSDAAEFATYADKSSNPDSSSSADFSYLFKICSIWSRAFRCKCVFVWYLLGEVAKRYAPFTLNFRRDVDKVRSIIGEVRGHSLKFKELYSWDSRSAVVFHKFWGYLFWVVLSCWDSLYLQIPTSDTTMQNQMRLIGVTAQVFNLPSLKCALSHFPLIYMLAWTDVMSLEPCSSNTSLKAFYLTTLQLNPSQINPRCQNDGISKCLLRGSISSEIHILPTKPDDYISRVLASTAGYLHIGRSSRRLG